MQIKVYCQTLKANNWKPKFPKQILSKFYIFASSDKSYPVYSWIMFVKHKKAQLKIWKTNFLQFFLLNLFFFCKKKSFKAIEQVVTVYRKLKKPSYTYKKGGTVL